MRTVATIAVLGVCMASRLCAQVDRIRIDSREPFAGGYSFPKTGPYERVAGSLSISVDPASPANARVTDLKLAPRNAKGKVELRADFVLLEPVDLSRGNHRLLYDVVNRGNKIAHRSFNDGSGNDPRTLAGAGNGFLMREGHVVLWTGWSGDVAPGGDTSLAAWPRRLPPAVSHRFGLPSRSRFGIGKQVSLP